VRRGLGDVDDRHVEQFLQALPPVLAEARLDDRVVRVGVARDGVHHGDGGQVALEVALHGVGPDVRGEGQDLGLGTGGERAEAAMASVIATVVLTFTTRMRTRRVCQERVLSGPN